MFSEWAQKQGDKFVLEPIGNTIKNIGSASWNWFVDSLPDIVGYCTLVAGGTIILSSMVGSGGIMKPIAVYAGLVIIAISILVSV